MVEVAPAKITGWHAMAQSAVDDVFVEYVRRLIMGMLGEKDISPEALELFRRNVERGVILRNKVWTVIDGMNVVIPP